MIYWPTKDPAATIDYGMDWGPTLSRLDDPTISSSTWNLISGDVVPGSDSVDADGRGTQVRISGGTDGTDAIVQNVVTLSDGQILEEEAYIKVRS